jgi:2,3-dihydro-2,3-dihydroxybenzoate dehydrogenase
LDGRIALVTGAAGGIGSAIVGEICSHGATVAMLDRDANALHAVATALELRGCRVRPFAVDVVCSSQVNAAVHTIERDLGPIDFLVNAAGVLHLTSAWELTDQQWQSTLDVNSTGVFTVSRAVVRGMLDRGRGSIVTVASNSAGTARMQMSAYAASKAAATAFTRCLGLELAGSGIRCNVVSPGSTNTAMFTGMWPDGSAAHRAVRGLPEDYRVGIPLGRVAEPSDIADSVLFLLSDRAAHITMQELVVDGGATLGR